jgi:hypothetical protein
MRGPRPSATLGSRYGRRGESFPALPIIISHKIGDEWTATEIQGYPDT